MQIYKSADEIAIAERHFFADLRYALLIASHNFSLKSIEHTVEIKDMPGTSNISSILNENTLFEVI